MMGGATSPPNVFGGPPPAAAAPSSGLGGLEELLGGGSMGTPAPLASLPGASTFATKPKEIWLPAARGKGMEIAGTFTRRAGQLFMDMTFANRALQPLSGFAIQFNKNSFGLVPGQALSVRSPLAPGQTVEASLPLATNGPIQKMDPLTNLQVAIKNDLDVFYFAAVVPMHCLFIEDGTMDKRLFLQAWKEIPPQNELQFNINNTLNLSPDDVCAKLTTGNVFTVARRTVEGQELLYHSLRFTNQIWVLSELKLSPGNPVLVLSLKSRNKTTLEGVHSSLEAVLQH